LLVLVTVNSSMERFSSNQIHFPPSWGLLPMQEEVGAILGGGAHSCRVLLTPTREIGILLPNNQRQHRTLRIQKNVLPSALC